MRKTSGGFLPNRLKDLADRDGLKMVHVAAHCDVDQATAYRWAKGTTQIPDHQKLRLAEFFDVSPAYLMAWDEQPEEAA